MRVTIKKQNNYVTGAIIKCSPLEVLTIQQALRTELLADRTLYKDYPCKERDIKLLEKMLEEMEIDIRGEE